MPRRTNPFQQLVYLIQEQLKDRPDAVVTESKMLVDRNTGKQRETDIAVECSANGVPFILAFECRKLSRKPAIEWVEQMLKKHEHLSDKLVLVANRPLTADAIDLARRNGVETVELSEATKTDWPARLDQYTNLLFTTFDFTVQTYSLEYGVPTDGPRFSCDQMVDLADMWGKRAPLPVAVNALINNHELVGKQVMELWYKKPPKERKNEHTVTFVYAPPSDQPMTVMQGTLSYPLQKLTIVMAVRIGQAPLPLEKAGYGGLRVAHGGGQIKGGSLAGETVRIVMTERQGQRPKAAVMLSGVQGTTRPIVRTTELLEVDASPTDGGKA